MRFLMLNWRDPKNPLAGGAERVSQAYLAGLAKRGHEVFWYSYDFPGAETTEMIDGVTIIRGGQFVMSILKARRWYRRQKRFDLVIDQHHGIPWFAPWWCGTHCIAFIHEVLGPIWSSFYPWPISLLGRWQEKWAHWFYRRIPFWTASVSTKESLMRHGVRNVTIIPYGVDLRALPELDHKALQRPLRLVMVSRLAPNKRIDHGISAVGHLVQKGLDVRLTIVGTGSEEPKLRERVAELRLAERVVFTGHVAESEKNELLRKSHFLLHTSVREGWGLNVIEANAMGTPAIVYPVSGLIESTEHNETGIVTEAETPESMAAAIQTILERPDPYQHFRLKAWERSKTFHWSNVLPKACEWLESQAGEKP